MPFKTSRRIATVLIAGLPFFSEGCYDVLGFIAALLFTMAYGTSTVRLADSCPSNLICQTPTCFVVGENGSFENGPVVQENREDIDTIRPNAWRPGGRRLKAKGERCRGLRGLHLHEINGATTDLNQAYQLINHRDLFPAGMPNEPKRLRVGASFSISPALATGDALLTIFTFSGLDPQSFPERGDPYGFASQATSIETTRVPVNDLGWAPIQTVLTMPPETDLFLVLLEYELLSEAPSTWNVYVDGVDIILDEGPYIPIANADRASTVAGESVRINVLANDLDPDGLIDSSTVAVVAAPPNGLADVNEDGSITYTPNPGFTGTDAFSYRFVDLDGLTAGALVTVNVLQGNRPPVAVADTVTTSPGVALDIDVLANDSDPDGDAIALLAAGNPPNGTAEIINNGQAVRYTPNAGYAGTDGFAYIIVDEHGAQSNEVEVTVIVQ